ncbi:MAG: hypothetical protein ACE5NP_04965 [Anaerolineae bacterium]
MKEIAPLQIGNLLKSFLFFLLGILVVWSGYGIWASGDILMPTALGLRLAFVAFMVILSAFLAWIFYKNYYHTTLSYDEFRFKLQKGREKIERNWSDFYKVSLFHLGAEQYVVRLYKDDDSFLEIPVSTLKLNPSEFRFKAMKLVKGASTAPVFERNVKGTDPGLTD